MFRRHLLAAFGVIALATAPAVAQDFNLSPTFGNINLNTGFFPDPHTASIVAGGGIDASASLGGNCRGSIANAPDIRLFFGAGSLPLIISAISSSDTTLVINDPSGQWFCDDDSAGSLNPQVTFNSPQSGQYDIWVGTFGGGTANATLNISEIGGGAGGGGGGGGNVGQGPDLSLSPTFGTINLNTGFFPDPNTTSLVAGGGIDASVNPGGTCNGSIAQAPDIRLFFNAGSLPLIISAISSSDTTLVINDPNGQWFCDDDSGGSLNPQVTFSNPQSGQYDIWVGTFGGGTTNATLNISEISNVVVQPPGKAPVPPPIVMPDFNLAPAFGAVNLTTGFQPDPHTVAITAGGFIDANAALGGNCQGSIAEAPDFRVNYSAGGLPLAFRVSSTSDTTLVINGPDGQWICDDDSGGKLNPLLRFNNPQSGQYDIWVGTFGGGTADSTLLVTETP